MATTKNYTLVRNAKNTGYKLEPAGIKVRPMTNNERGRMNHRMDDEELALLFFMEWHLADPKTRVSYINLKKYPSAEEAFYWDESEQGHEFWSFTSRLNNAFFRPYL